MKYLISPTLFSPPFIFKVLENLEKLYNLPKFTKKFKSEYTKFLLNGNVVYLLKPHFNSFNKTIVKRPKIYFYDTGG